MSRYDGRTPEPPYSTELDISETAQKIADLRQQLAEEHELREKAEAALAPFAAIKPSSFFPRDGSLNEGYAVVLHWKESAPVHDMTKEKPDFTGTDLARARAISTPV